MSYSPSCPLGRSQSHGPTWCKEGRRGREAGAWRLTRPSATVCGPVLKMRRLKFKDTRSCSPVTHLAGGLVLEIRSFSVQGTSVCPPPPPSPPALTPFDGLESCAHPRSPVSRWPREPCLLALGPLCGSAVSRADPGTGTSLQKRRGVTVGVGPEEALFPPCSLWGPGRSTVRTPKPLSGAPIWPGTEASRRHPGPACRSRERADSEMDAAAQQPRGD